MRRTASEIIRHLENRVAHLERVSAPRKGKSLDQQLDIIEGQKTQLMHLKNAIQTVLQLKSDLNLIKKGLKDVEGAEALISNLSKLNVRGAEKKIQAMKLILKDGERRIYEQM
jgi:hypothetical protein